ncbi:tryptophan halogenase family protein [Alteromonas facilis]|uniref:tryptophan halogenase family protein n=1 Tax=Alteromonas facilis TaxID=2048004 RepID=UPI000C2954AE|nr:tryptophan halogenase family protein [Alteromonas facilis]
MQHPISSLVIVGGGTAGWLCAAYMAKMLPQKRDKAVKITLIESPDIKTIGVGEGTWPTMRTTLARIGISETRFLRECSATFKQASKFVNWRYNPGEISEDFYYHLFDAPSLSWPLNPVPYWLEKCRKGEAISYADAISVQQQACERGLAPKTMTTPEYEGLLHYAYHLDAGKFAQLLQSVATQDLGVEHILANVTEIHLNGNGDIQSLDTDRAGSIQGDLFFDCTGFACKLLGDTLNVPFKSYSDILLTDSAVAIQMPYADDEQEVKPFTQSTAQEHGWIWDIGLPHRRGTGYVYSSRYTSKEEAEQLLRNYLGSGAESLPAKHLSIKSGRREKIWQNNCVAIGLSAAFMEPLEASAIFLIEASCYMLADMFPADRSEVDYIATQFNQSFAYRWDKVVEFIKLHYVLSGRTDSAFWRDNKDPSTWPQGLAEKLTQWKSAVPSKYEFSHAFEPFTRESYEFILFGMQQPSALTELSKLNAQQDDMADEAFDVIEQRKQRLTGALTSHRALLNRINQERFPVQS